MNVNMINDLEAKASLMGLWDCHNMETLDRRIAKWDELMRVTPDAILVAALDDPAIFENWLYDPVTDYGDGIDNSLNA